MDVATTAGGAPRTHTDLWRINLKLLKCFASKDSEVPESLGSLPFLSTPRSHDWFLPEYENLLLCW